MVVLYELDEVEAMIDTPSIVVSELPFEVRTVVCLFLLIKILIFSRSHNMDVFSHNLIALICFQQTICTADVKINTCFDYLRLNTIAVFIRVIVNKGDIFNVYIRHVFFFLDRLDIWHYI